MLFEEQRIFVERLVKNILDIEDAKIRKTYFISLVEDCLSKKPFAKHLVPVLIEKVAVLVGSADLDFVKVARECLKSLTSEDFMQLY